MRSRNLAWLAAVVLVPIAAFAESPKPRQENAERSATIAAAARQAWAITDLVLEKDIDPPARQQMLLHGLKVLLRQGKGKRLSNLAERVSAVTTPDQRGEAAPRTEMQCVAAKPRSASGAALAVMLRRLIRPRGPMKWI
jgi:hypothetical protein